ncbi:YdeI/OmpD-associated family protein [Flammeovirga sp. SubArs3]|uniref:YdeI/OmpD-associated family protein n=1 Tax=Flammeovirga sp. SubArs3 TaxID=2995316 RepID=UPI00248ACD5B|nr:YdeI/OmpD-associated family protein [Flammeovirga sp. SubArs3]
MNEVKKKLIIQRFEGKGGWHFVDVPEIEAKKNTHFGWTTVSGSVDDIALDKVKLMPKGNGFLFLPLNAQLRKKLKKGEGDEVLIHLYRDDAHIQNTSELESILSEISKEAQQCFVKLPKSRQKDYVQWIFDNRDENVQVTRINELIDQLLTNNQSVK